MFGWSIGATVAAVALFSGVTYNTPWRQMLEPFGVAIVYTVSIVPIAAYTMPRVMPALRRIPVPFNWVLIVAVMIALGMTGSVVAIGLLRATGYIPAGHVGAWFLGSVRSTIGMTLLFGLSISAFESMRARLDNTTMALRIKERDEAEARRLAAEAQFAALESRVNPHFLFNTLNSIATLVHDNPGAAERMTTELASLLRSSLDTTTPLVPLDEELRIVRAYLDIERVRFGDRLRYHVDDTASGHVSVPRLAVQTLVENSVKYAVASRREGGIVAVRAGAEAGRARVVVEDDGPGFDGAAVKEGHGLALVRARLNAAFGDSASLTIASEPGRTQVTIEMPAANARGEPAEPRARPSTSSGRA